MNARAPITALAVLGLAAAALALGGCNTGPRPAPGAGNDPTAANYPRVTVDGPLQQYLVVDYAGITARPPSDSQPLFVQVPTRSQADNEFAIQHNFTWYDAGGVQVGESGWRTVVLPSRRQMMLSANAMTRAAVNWRLDIRSAR